MCIYFGLINYLIFFYLVNLVINIFLNKKDLVFAIITRNIYSWNYCKLQVSWFFQWDGVIGICFCFVSLLWIIVWLFIRFYFSVPGMPGCCLSGDWGRLLLYLLGRRGLRVRSFVRFYTHCRRIRRVRCAGGWRHRIWLHRRLLRGSPARAGMWLLLWLRGFLLFLLW